MAAAARGPRRYITAKQRKGFGRPAPLTWPAHQNKTERLAAYRQHLLACAVNDAREEAGMTLVALAKELGMRTETLRRKIRGDTWISLVDATALALAFPNSPITPGQPLIIPEPPSS